MPIDDETINSNTKDRYVAFFDIMGFKDSFNRGSHEEVAQQMKSFADAVNSAHERTKKSETAALLGGILHLQDRVVHHAIISDCVILYTENVSKLSLHSIINAISWLLTDCIEKNIPIKGALAKGKFTASKEESLYFGRPLIDAYELAEQLHYYGAVFHHSAENDARELSGIVDNMVYVRRVPFKRGKIAHAMITPLPLKQLVAIVSLDRYMAPLRRFYLTVSGDTRKYVDNTIDLYADILGEDSDPQKYG